MEVVKVIKIVNQASCFESGGVERRVHGAESMDSYALGHTHSQESNGVDGELVILIVAHDCNGDFQLLRNRLDGLNEVKIVNSCLEGEVKDRVRR